MNSITVKIKKQQIDVFSVCCFLVFWWYIFQKLSDRAVESVTDSD